ncbi:MAG: SDR family oxidoreductase [Acidobacteriota bacterium]|jgi:dTDP-4-dehydrorhamnose reductase
MKALILGGEGMLGHKMFQILRARYSDTGCTIFGSLAEPFYRRIDLLQTGFVLERVNAMDLSVLGQTLASLKPEFIVNCIGIVKQREEAKSAIPSITLNSLLPHKLAEYARAWGGRVIHFSTDCVFSGNKGRYTEEDPSDAEDLYGRSKYLGEVPDENALTLRTSIIGRELSQFKSLLEWFLAQRGKTTKGFRKVIYSGVTTNYISELVGRVISEHPTLHGLYQVTSPPISKHELLCRLRDAYQLDVEIQPYDGEVSDRSMIGEKFIHATGYRYPTWRELIAQLVNDPTPYKNWRS